MPRVKRITQVGAGTTVPIPLDYTNPQFGVTVAGMTASGAFTIELTTDDVQDPDYDPSAGLWVTCAEIGSATESALAHLASPVTAVRLVVTSGTVRLDVLHG